MKRRKPTYKSVKSRSKRLYHEGQRVKTDQKIQGGKRVDSTSKIQGQVQHKKWGDVKPRANQEEANKEMRKKGV